jgi:dipeptidyl-peptidase 4
MRVSSLLLIVLLPGLCTPQKKPVTVDAVVAAREAAEQTPEIVWAPAGDRLAFKQGDELSLFDPSSKERRHLLSLSDLEAPVTAAAGEQWKNRHVKEQTLQWFPDGRSLLVLAGSDLFVYQTGRGNREQLTKSSEAEQEPQLSPDGHRISFRKGNELYVLDIASKRVTRLTRDAAETRWNARLDWVYPEELDLSTAHWWSPDSHFIAYLQFDVSQQPLYPHADLLPLRPVSEPQRYPKAGDPNADVRLGVVPAAGGRTRWMDLGGSRDDLLARVYWTPDSKSVFVERLNRIQNRLELVRADIATGASRVILREEDAHWVDLAGDLHFLRNGQEFLRTSERDGFRHIYLHSADGRELRRLTQGDWEVTEIAGVDESSGRVYFVSTSPTPLERHLYSVPLSGGETRRITWPAGTHSILMAPGCKNYLDTFSSFQSPPRRSVFRTDGVEQAVFLEADRTPIEEYDLQPAQIVDVRTTDGASLQARLIRPAGFRPGRKYPAVVIVYGGPHAQDVVNEWMGPSTEQLLASRGFVVWQLDNRGSAGRGHRWETALFRNLGARELEDQKEGIERLVAMGFVDPARIGIHGWSYGGYMTLYSLLNAPELFRAGVAGAPVTDWRNYDTIYTERYMGLPADNPEGYRRSSPVHFAAQLKAKLLLVHNFEDDNVLYQNTLQMADALQKAGKPFELMTYPLKTHGTSGAYRRHFLETLISFFERTLKD